MGTARAGHKLTAAEERRAAYLATYFESDADDTEEPPHNATARAKKCMAVHRPSAESTSAPTLTIEQKLKRAFRLADSDGSKTVSKRELYVALERVGITRFSGPEGLRIFQEAGSNGDGQLTVCARHTPQTPTLSVICRLVAARRTLVAARHSD